MSELVELVQSAAAAFDTKPGGLADILGVPRSTVIRWAKGERQPSRLDELLLRAIVAHPRPLREVIRDASNRITLRHRRLAQAMLETDEGGA